MLEEFELTSDFNQYDVSKAIFSFKKNESESEVAQSCPTLCDPMDIAHQVPPSMGFSRQEYWSGLPFPFPGDHPNPGSEPMSPALWADALLSEPPGNPLKKKKLT